MLALCVHTEIERSKAHGIDDAAVSMHSAAGLFLCCSPMAHRADAQIDGIGLVIVIAH